MFQTAFFRAHTAVFALVAPSLDRVEGLATAFCVRFGDKVHFLSAAHAVEHFDRVSLVRTFRGRTEYPFEVERVELDLDLAILRCRSATIPEGPPLQLASGPAQYGMSACVVGYPVSIRMAGLPPMLNVRIAGGTVASDIDLSTAVPPHPIRLPDAFEFDTNLHPGFSGAPVLDVTGGLIGCVSHSFLRPNTTTAEGHGAPATAELNFTVCVGAETLRKFLAVG